VLYFGEELTYLLAKKRVSFGIPRSPLKKIVPKKKCPNFRIEGAMLRISPSTLALLPLK